MVAGGAAAGGAFAGMMIANNIKRLNDGIAAAKESWAGLRSHGLTLDVVDDRPVLTGDVNGVSVTVKVVTDVVKYSHTVVDAPAPGAVNVEAGVFPSPAGLLGKVRALISQDIIIGDEVFDEAFLIQGKPESAVTALLSARMRELLTALAGAHLSGFKLADGVATVQLVGVEQDVSVLEVAIDVVVQAAKWSALWQDETKKP